jgi:hypothetical protein
MTPEQIIRLLEANAQPAPDDDEDAAMRAAARILWFRKTLDAMLAAQRRVTEAWGRIFDELGDAADDLSDEELEAIPKPAEQAEVDRLYELIAAVRDRDQWPKHLHWTL